MAKQTAAWRRGTPQTEDVVLVTIIRESGLRGVVTAFHDNGIWYEGTTGDRLRYAPLAWMPMPKPYRPEKQK